MSKRPVAKDTAPATDTKLRPRETKAPTRDPKANAADSKAVNGKPSENPQKEVKAKRALQKQEQGKKEADASPRRNELRGQPGRSQKPQGAVKADKAEPDKSDPTPKSEATQRRPEPQPRQDHAAKRVDKASVATQEDKPSQGQGARKPVAGARRTDRRPAARHPAAEPQAEVKTASEVKQKKRSFSRPNSKRGSAAQDRQDRSNSALSNTPSEVSEDDQDHVNVVVRVRPLNSAEEGRGEKVGVQFPGDGAIWVDNNGTTKPYTFNVTFEPEATQSDLFENSGIMRLIDMALNGYSCTAFAFGQTGSGKTYTMTGPAELSQDGSLTLDEDRSGLIPRSLQHLWRQLRQLLATGANYNVQASYLEIYNEQVVDLLNPSQSHHLNVRWSKNKGFYVENLFVVDCENMDDMLAVLEEGLRNRQTGAHNLNEHSSRSHTMLQLMINSELQEQEDDSLFVTKRGKLTFVDLAGSEKVKDSGSTGDAMVETNNINKSLLVLGNCISALSDPKKRQGHVPYRDSKLTKLLADSIGGNGVALMIACISPSSANLPESMKTLRYASRAKKIKNKPVIRMDPREQLIMDLKKEVKLLRQENFFLRQQLGFPEKPEGRLQVESDKKTLKDMREKQMKSSKEGVKGRGAEKSKEAASDNQDLYTMLQEYMEENESMRKHNADMQQLRDRIQREQEFLSRENERLTRKLESLQMVVTPQSVPGSLGSMSRNDSAMDPYNYPSPLSTPPYHVNGWIGQTPPNGAAGYNGHANGYRKPGMKPPHHLPQHSNAYKQADTYGQRHQLRQELRHSQPEFPAHARMAQGVPANPHPNVPPGYPIRPHMGPPGMPPPHLPQQWPPQGAPNQAYFQHPPQHLPNGGSLSPRGRGGPSLQNSQPRGGNNLYDKPPRPPDRLVVALNQRNDGLRSELNALDHEIKRQNDRNAVHTHRR